MRIDWLSKLRHLLQILAFGLAISAIQYAFTPDKPYGPSVVYSLWIASLSWAVIDLGRHLLPSSAETGWPQGWAGWALIVGGLAFGYFGGSFAADRMCRAFGWYSVTRAAGDDTLRNVLISAIAGSVGTFYFYSVNKSAYLQRKMVEARQHASEARLKLLEVQLEPHMLFNTLANLRVLIATDATRAQKMLDHMIAYLRATLDASRHATHPLQTEFDRLRDYLELMAVRMGPRLAFSFDLPAELAQQPVPTLLLQPLVENSIQHGLEPKVAGGSVHIAARREGAMLVLEVQDTGVGLQGAVQAGEGFGLVQVRERLQTLHGQAAAIDLVAAEVQGTRATVRFPLKS